MKDIIINNIDIIGKKTTEILQKIPIEVIVALGTEDIGSNIKVPNKFCSDPLMTKLRLTQIQKEVIFGIMPGDGSITSKTLFETARMNIHHSLTQVDYAKHKIEIFQNIIKQTPNIKLGVLGSKSPNGSIFCSTVINQDIAEIGRMFYKFDEFTGKFIKVIPETFKDYLTERGLAYWLMDDAGQSINVMNNHKISRQFRIATNHCTLTELAIIKDLFESKWGLKVTFPIAYKDPLGIHTQYLTTIAKESHNALYQLVKPYIIPSMQYKFEGLESLSLMENSEIKKVGEIKALEVLKVNFEKATIHQFLELEPLDKSKQ